MNQIALGDQSAYIVLEGQSINPPYKTAAVFFNFSSEPIVKESLQIQLSGTVTQVSNAIAALEATLQRITAYRANTYPYVQYLRFQPAAGGDYFYAPLIDAYLEANPAGYKTRQTGSLLLTLHYTRPNYFDGAKTELPLTTKGALDLTDGVTILNHTCNDVGHSNTVLIKPAHYETELPAPLRIEVQNEFTSPIPMTDFHFGIYHHPTHLSDSPFFYHGADLAGGTSYADAGAINGYFRRYTWSPSVWTPLFAAPISATQINILEGRAYRPYVHLFNPFAYADLYLKFQIERGSDLLYVSESVYADPAYQCVFFPPVNLPPTRLLRETLPHSSTLVFYAKKGSAAAYTLDVDQLVLQPLDFSASFLGFYGMNKGDLLIYDSHRGLHNVRYSAVGSETVAHVLQGGPLLLSPNTYTRLFTAIVLSDGSMQKDRTVKIKAFYRKRVRLL